MLSQPRFLPEQCVIYHQDIIYCHMHNLPLVGLKLYSANWINELLGTGIQKCLCFTFFKILEFWGFDGVCCFCCEMDKYVQKLWIKIGSHLCFRLSKHLTLLWTSMKVSATSNRFGFLQNYFWVLCYLFMEFCQYIIALLLVGQKEEN